MNWKGCRRKWLRLHLRHCPAIFLEGLKKPQDTSIRTAGAPTKNQTGHLPDNTITNHEHLMIQFGLFVMTDDDSDYT
jgi:hypothetical protein